MAAGVGDDADSTIEDVVEDFDEGHPRELVNESPMFLRQSFNYGVNPSFLLYSIKFPLSLLPENQNCFFHAFIRL